MTLDSFEKKDCFTYIFFAVSFSENIFVGYERGICEYLNDCIFLVYCITLYVLGAFLCRVLGMLEFCGRQTFGTRGIQKYGSSSLFVG